ncbi:unnamed protein product [Arabidopsis lyrata]|uniref:Expressed protein n=1 Tax=Arabidopsis lyrata subsp. lyrata TaxID=81972 RepID=D7KKE8_ARALL|nr:expressed protein [Arabidopsis lyrata subsp. lyrata]CAH8255496.1 unnamed protein product [Arabidopsis lyrata]
MENGSWITISFRFASSRLAGGPVPVSICRSVWTAAQIVFYGWRLGFLASGLVRCVNRVGFGFVGFSSVCCIRDGPKGILYGLYPEIAHWA